MEADEQTLAASDQVRAIADAEQRLRLLVDAVTE